MAKPVEVEDEQGVTWVVFEGDAAWEPIQKLKKLGCSYVVLQRQALLTGRIVAVQPPLISDLGPLDEEAKQAILRLVRMHDCTHYLTKEVMPSEAVPTGPTTESAGGSPSQLGTTSDSLTGPDQERHG